MGERQLFEAFEVKLKLSSILASRPNDIKFIDIAAEAHMLGCKCETYDIENVVIEKTDSYSVYCEKCSTVLPVFLQ